MFVGVYCLIIGNLMETKMNINQTYRDALATLVEKDEMGIYKLSEVVSLTPVNDTVVAVYRVVGAEAHHADSMMTRVALITNGRITHSLIVPK